MKIRLATSIAAVFLVGAGCGKDNASPKNIQQVAQGEAGNLLVMQYYALPG